MQKLPLPAAGLLLLVTSLFTTSIFALDFGPGPDPVIVEAERQRLLAEHEAMGDNAFAIHLIAQLDFVIEALPPRHPRFVDRALEAGTPEHFYVTRPYFIQHAVAMLVELDDDRALPVLWDFVLLYDRTVIDQYNDRVRMGVGVHTDEYAVGAAWLSIAASEVGPHAAIARLADLRTRSWAIVNYVNQRAGENPEAWEGNAFLFIDDDNQDDNLLIHLATSRGRSMRLSQNMDLIDDISGKLMWVIDHEQMDAYLAHDNLRVRVAAATVDYRQRSAVPALMAKHGHDLWLDEEESQGTKETLAVVWHEVLDARAVLLAQAPEREPNEHHGNYNSRLHHYQTKLEQNTVLLNHLMRITAEDHLDATFRELRTASEVGRDDR